MSSAMKRASVRLRSSVRLPKPKAAVAKEEAASTTSGDEPSKTKTKDGTAKKSDRRKLGKKKMPDGEESMNSLDVDGVEAQLDLTVPELNFETTVLSEPEDVINESFRLLEELSIISANEAGWKRVNDDVTSKHLRGSVSKRRLRVHRGYAMVGNMSAPRLHALFQTREGMHMLDPFKDILEVRKPVFGPFQVGEGNASAHLDFVQGIGQGLSSKTLMLLCVCDNDMLRTVYSSCLFKDVPGGSSYQSEEVQELSGGRDKTRAAYLCEYRCVPVDKESCLFFCTMLMDVGGLSSTNARDNKMKMQLVVNRVKTFGDVSKNPSGTVTPRKR